MGRATNKQTRIQNNRGEQYNIVDNLNLIPLKIVEYCYPCRACHNYSLKCAEYFTSAILFYMHVSISSRSKVNFICFIDQSQILVYLRQHLPLPQYSCELGHVHPLILLSLSFRSH